MLSALNIVNTDQIVADAINPEKVAQMFIQNKGIEEKPPVVVSSDKEKKEILHNTKIQQIFKIRSYFLSILTNFRINSKVFITFTKFTQCLSPMTSYYPMLKKPSKFSFLYKLKKEQKTTEFIKGTNFFIKKVTDDRNEEFYESLGQLTQETNFIYQTVEERILNVRMISRKWIQMIDGKLKNEGEPDDND